MDVAAGRWPPTAATVTSYFNGRAPTYDGSAMHRWLAARVVAECPPDPGADVLDIAAGTGLVSREVARIAGGRGRFVALDLSPDMLAAARAAMPDLAGVRADATRLPLASARFDLVVCVAAVAYLPDPAGMLREAYRALRPGGRIAVQGWTADGIAPGRILRAAAARHGVPVTDPQRFLGTPEDAIAVLTTAGFTGVRVITDTWPQSLPEPEAAWRSQVHGIMGGRLRGVPPDLLEAIGVDFRAALAAEIAAGARDDQRVLIATARKPDPEETDADPVRQ